MRRVFREGPSPEASSTDLSVSVLFQIFSEENQFISCLPVWFHMVLNHATFSMLAIIFDASPVGLVAILCQDNHVVAYASRSLTVVEQRYT